MQQWPPWHHDELPYNLLQFVQIHYATLITQALSPTSQNRGCWALRLENVIRCKHCYFSLPHCVQ
jgi:hypothetical protein